MLFVFVQAFLQGSELHFQGACQGGLLLAFLAGFLMGRALGDQGFLRLIQTQALLAMGGLQQCQFLRQSSRYRLRFGTHCLDLSPGLLLQPHGEPLHQVLQRLADAARLALAALLFFQFLQVFVDCSLGAGIAQLHPNGVYRRMPAQCQQGIARFLHFRFVEAGTCHGPNSLFDDVLHNT